MLEKAGATATPIAPAAFSLSEEQQALADLARDFAQQHLSPHAVAWDETKHFPVDVLREAAALGIGGIYIREDVGGSALTRLDAALIFEGAGDGLPLDRGLYLDPQHGVVDDRPLRLGCATPPLPAAPRDHGAFVELLPHRAGRGLGRSGAQDAGAA